MSFLTEQIDYFNTTIKNAAEDIVRTLDATIAANLTDFYNRMYLSDCLSWNVIINADIRINDFGPQQYLTLKVIGRHGEYAVIYDGTQICRLKLDESDGIIRLGNLAEVIYDFKSSVCLKHKTLKHKCKCFVPQNEYLLELSTASTDLLLDIDVDSEIQVPARKHKEGEKTNNIT